LLMPPSTCVTRELQSSCVLPVAWPMLAVLA
jgi:hypothetical protein